MINACTGPFQLLNSEFYLEKQFCETAVVAEYFTPGLDKTLNQKLP